MPEAARVIGYHVVIAGHVEVAVPGERTVSVAPGGVILLPQGDVHFLGSAQGIDPAPAHDLLHRVPDSPFLRIDHGGGGEPAHL
jgi:hypothetical protein